MYRLLIILIFAIGTIGVSEAKVSRVKVETVRDSVRVNFRQSKVVIDTNYMGNREAFEHVKESIKRFHQPDSNFVLRDVKVIGGASPEGSWKFNEWLSKERANRIYDYMDSKMLLPDSLTTRTLLGRDWEGLLTKVENDPNVPARDEVVSALNEIIGKTNIDKKESDAILYRLKHIDRGIPYLYLYRNIFPSLRESKVILTFGVPENPRFPNINMPLMISTTATPEGVVYIPVEEPKRDRPFYMALKTNMLYDLLAVPEGSIEFYLGKNLSIVGNWMYGWWDNDHLHKYWRIYGGDVALRWWFGKAAHIKPLTGHHVGLYAGLVTYDFEFGGKGYMGGLPGRPLWARCNHHFGVEYGYSLPIARRLNIDFTLGLGYLGGKYIEYIPEGKCYVWQATKYKHYFGPTKLEVSLTWLIGHGNFNAKKGGKL